jgi:hypothetical protein
MTRASVFASESLLRRLSNQRPSLKLAERGGA